MSFDFPRLAPVIAEPVDKPLTAEASLLPLRQLDELLRLSAGFAAQLTDHRQTDLVEHALLEMVRSRMFGIMVGYEDQNDHDALRR